MDVRLRHLKDTTQRSGIKGGKKREVKGLIRQSEDEFGAALQSMGLKGAVQYGGLDFGDVLSLWHRDADKMRFMRDRNQMTADLAGQRLRKSRQSRVNLETQRLNCHFVDSHSH